MERFKSLGMYQKCILIIVIAMSLIFAVIYSSTVSRVGYAYKDSILILGDDCGSTVYSGKINGEQASFTLSSDKTVQFRYGGSLYGPYSATEDPAAIPEDSELKNSMTGVELRCGDEVIFRGGVMEHANERWLYNEDGSIENIKLSFVTSSGVTLDENGNETDPMEPTASAILDIMAGPELTHKGDWSMWLLGLFVCAATAVSILFADELFRWNLSFQIRNPDRAEPSDWEIAWRYISWTVLPILALIVFILGLGYTI